MDMLKEAFPEKIDLDELVQEISAFEGAWQYYYPLMNAYSLASPVFNDDGDLLFELRRHGHATLRPPAAPGSVLGQSHSPSRPRSPAFWGRSSSGRSRTPSGILTGPNGGGLRSPSYTLSPPPTNGRHTHHLNGENTLVVPSLLDTELFAVQAPIPTTHIELESAEFISVANGKTTTNEVFDINALPASQGHKA